MDLLEVRPAGVYSAAGDFYIDPWEAVERAVVSNAGRARPGCGAYLTAAAGAGLVAERAGTGTGIETVAYGARTVMGDLVVSLHPAGHLPGSAQVRIECRGRVSVFAADYRPVADPTCEPFEPVRCQTLLTGAAFALPIFRWPAEAEVMAALHEWWRGNHEAGRTSVLYAAPLGVSQRVLARIDAAIGTLWLHAEIEKYCAIYRARGIGLPSGGAEAGASLKIAPPGWGRRGARVSTAMVSGWMRIRGTRRRRSLDRGFVLSGQADWTGVLGVIEASGAETVGVLYGFRAPLARWLEEHGRRAHVLDTRLEETES